MRAALRRTAPVRLALRIARRLHQQSFRERVIRAYQDRCAIFRIAHDELLKAPHILPDGHPRGKPIVPKGLVLCKLHHAPFDRHILRGSRLS